MRKRISVWMISFMILSLVLAACKNNKTAEQERTKIEVTEDGELEVYEKDALPLEIITQNEDKYPIQDLNIFEDNDVSDRLKKIAGKEEYEAILDNFETETPIVSDDGIYKFTGCKQHDCPSFLTTVLYDADEDNFNLVIEKEGKTKVYDEKGKITVSKALQAK